jgi:hypothetical protein
MHKLDTRFETYARLSGDERFKCIAEGQLRTFDELNPKVRQLRDRKSEILSTAADPDDPPDEYYDIWMELNPLEEERDQACIIACVFTALYFEALIYDYAASCLGDEYVRAHLDKLDFISKWLVVPRLTVGKQLDKSRHAYSALRQLQKDRNSLVHLKSREMSFSNEKMIEYLEKRENDIQRTANNCQAALKVVVQELHELDPTHPKLVLLIKGGESA